MPHRVVALASSPQSMFELASASEVFGISRPGVETRYEWGVCTRVPGTVSLLGGGEMTVPLGLERLAEADTVIVTGYMEYEHPAHPDVLAALRAAHDRGSRVVSICSGAFLLAQAGLLAGRAATVHWRMQQDFERLHPEVDLAIDALYVDHGDLATSAGTAAGIDLCLHLVRRDFGAGYASEIARHMVMPPHREGGQIQYRAAAIAPAAHALAPLLEWAEARLDSDLSVEVLAGRANTSPRTLTRRFVAELGTSPGRWVLSRRIDAAKVLLEETSLTVDAIAARVGLSTALNLRRRFQDAVGTGPASYRRTFNGTVSAAAAPGSAARAGDSRG